MTADIETADYPTRTLGAQAGGKGADLALYEADGLAGRDRVCAVNDTLHLRRATA